MSECVKVMVRVRPMNKLEKEKSSKCIVSVDGHQVVITKDQIPKVFAYDYVFPMDVTQSYIYQSSAFSLVQSVVQGYNGTIFAYGQTGCGKTYTMMGGDKEDTRGIIPRSFGQIMSIIDNTKDKKFLVRVCFIEIYNEEVHDLLSKDLKQKKEVKENPGSGFYVKDLVYVTVKTAKDMQIQMNAGFKNRAVGETLMNKQSSRSHSIFSVLIETELNQCFTLGKLNFVDLAGSQKQSKTKAEGDRLKQAVKINLSLSTLGNVISALVDGKSHVPYRVSKLTKLLQDSLGGNTKTIMFANISPADYNYQQTLSTLHYASRAKFIQNKPKVNEDPKDAMLKEFAQEIKRLKAMLEGNLPVQSHSQKRIKNQHKYQNQLMAKDEMLQRQKSQKEQIEKKLKALTDNMVQGGAKNNSQEQKNYEQLKEKIKLQKEEQSRLVEQKKAKQIQLVQVKNIYKDAKEENQQLTRIYHVQKKRLEEIQKQKKQEMHQANQEIKQIAQTVHNYDKEIKFMQFIVEKIISQKDIDIIKSDSDWNQDTKEYKIPPFKLKGKKLQFFNLDSYTGLNIHQVMDLIEKEKSQMDLVMGSEKSKKNLFDGKESIPFITRQFKIKKK